MSKVLATEGRIIGKFEGREVYKVTLSEYVNNRYYKDKYYVFLIDGELIYNNEAFASYDGNYVTDYDAHKKRVFYEIPKCYRDTPTTSGVKKGYEAEMKTSSTSGYSIETMSVDDAIASAYDTDYFSGMTDVDAFLKSALENF